MSQWKKEVSQAQDPLLNYQGVPILGQQGGGAQYKGRIVLELWETSLSDQVAHSVDSLGGDSQVLLQRALKALSSKLQKQKDYKRLQEGP